MNLKMLSLPERKLPSLVEINKMTELQRWESNIKTGLRTSQEITYKVQVLWLTSRNNQKQ